MLESRQHMPNSNRLSILSSAVLLTYALTRLIETQSPTLNWNFFGVAIAIPLNISIAATFLAAGLTAAGMDWILRSHPSFAAEISLQHWLLPALTAFVLGIALYNLPSGPAWWLGLFLGGVLLLLICLSEYIVLDTADTRYTLASAGLIAVSFSIFLFLAASLEYAGARLLLIILVIFPASGLVGLRAMSLRLNGRWEWQWAMGIALITSQIAAATHYWPVSPVQYGLIVLSPVYVISGIAISLGEGASMKRALIEAAIFFSVFWLAAIALQS